jgi:diadenylate cyclase
VIEREIALDDFMSTGKEVDAVVSAELLRAIFSPASRLHDGAVVVRGDRIAAASCVLPLTERDDVGALLGTRHRAALGLSETTDAAVVVVSEESGAVSLTVQGRLFTGLADSELTSRLVELLKPSEPQPVSWFRRIKRASAKSGV